MKVINLHQRTINQPKEKIEALFKTLASKNDLMLATNKWPAMQLDKGLQVDSKGGHGPIKYTVTKYTPDHLIAFEFTKPRGFNGYHQFEIKELTSHSTLIKHTIEMNTVGFATLKWLIAIRWLHDAYIEDAFDKVENHFIETGKKKSEWTIWVKFLRKMLQPKRKENMSKIDS